MPIVNQVGRSALVLTGRLQRMVSRLMRGDGDADLRDSIARLASVLAVSQVDIDREFDARLLRLAGPDAQEPSEGPGGGVPGGS